jgi:hypothetical protein
MTQLKRPAVGSVEKDGKLMQNSEILYGRKYEGGFYPKSARRRQAATQAVEGVQRKQIDL